MIRKYHKHTLQTNKQHRGEEPQNTNSHKTSGRHFKQSNQLTNLLTSLLILTTNNKLTVNFSKSFIFGLVYIFM